MQKKVINFLPLVATIMMLMLVLLSVQSNPFSIINPQLDSSSFIYFGHGMKDGLIPYKDMFDNKGPFLVLLNFIAVILDTVSFGNGLFIIEFVFLAVSFYFMYKLSSFFKVGSCIYVIALLFITPALTQFISFGNYTEEYAFTFILISLYIFLDVLLHENKSAINYILIGIFGSCTLLLRLNMVATWIVFFLVLVSYYLLKKQYKAIIKGTLWIMFGASIVALVFIVYGIATHSFKEMIDDSIIFNLSYSSTTFSQKLANSLDFYNAFQSKGFILFTLLYVLIIGFNWNNFNLKIKFMHIGLIIAALINFYTVIMSGRFYGHYGLTQLPYFFLFIILTLSMILNQQNVHITRAILSALIVIPFVMSFQNVKGTISYVNVTGSGTANQNQIINYIQMHSDKSQKIYAHNIGANFYTFSQRYANSKYFLLPAVNFNENANLKIDFVKSFSTKLPEYIVISQDVYLGKNLNNDFMNEYIVRTINAKYTKINVVDGEFALFKMKDK